MSVINRIALCMMLGCTSLAYAQTSQPATSQPADLQRGEFHTTFTERSPLSTPKELARRFNAKPGPDYDLAKDPFSVYVPSNYDPATPCGVIVFLCYKHSHETAPTLHDLFDKDHLIFAVTEEVPATRPERIGTALDAVYNLSSLYKIDPNRIWVLGEPPAQEAAMAFPDVFTAGIYRQAEYFRPIQSQQPNSGAYKPLMAHPLAEYIAKSKAHRHVILQMQDPDEYHQLVAKAFSQDGFKEILTIEVGLEPYHYPNFATDWFEQVVSFLDAPPTPAMSAAAKKMTRPAAASARADAPPSAAHPTESPAPSDPQKMLNLAKSYISARAYAPARKRLNNIIELYPTDPAATEAKQLLDSLPPAQ